MVESSIHKAALDALRTRTLIRLPYAGGEASKVRTKPVPGADPEWNHAIARAVDSVWEEKRHGCFDGALMGVADASITENEATLNCRTIGYRHYLATDAILDAFPDSSFPLAVGVHVILACRAEIVCLRLKSGRIALPGGAVDAQDLAHSPDRALVQAASREVAEETGVGLEGYPAQFTGLYVGGYPTHILAMLYIDVSDADIERTVKTFRPSDALDQVRSIELKPLDDLVGTIANLPLVLRAALRSLRHWRGDEPAWTIAT